MMRMRRGRRSALLLAACLSLCAAAAQMARSPALPVPRLQSPLKLVATAQPRQEQDAKGPPRGETLSRPVFSPTRRPYVPPAPIEAPAEAAAPPVEQAPPPLEAVSLIGVLIDDERRQALLAGPSEPQGKWVAIGDRIGGYAVESIDAGAVRLSSAAGPTRLQLYVENTQEASPRD